VDEYRATIGDVIALHTQASQTSGESQKQLLEQAADRLGSITLVQTPSGALVPIDNMELVALIRNPLELQAAFARLTALEKAMALPLPVPESDELGRLQAILNAPPFVTDAQSSWLQQVLAAILEFLERLLSNTAQGVFDVRDLLVVAALVVLAGILFYFFRNLRRNLVAEEALAPQLTEADARTPAEAFDNAQRFISAGDYRSAVRQLYIATLLLLDQRGRIKYDPTLTNREYLSQASNDARTTAALQPIVETFDRTWYGFEPITAAEFELYRRRVEEVKGL
jgi:hypothetical protein